MQKQSIKTSTFKQQLLLFLAILGPGMIAMLADTDAGSIVTAAQSGAMYGYKLIALQVILIPILYIVQELTIRLGIATGVGHGGLIKKHFGKFWAWFSVITLIICCTGAMATEISGIASVGVMFHMPIWLSVLLTTIFLVWLALSQSYTKVERVALAVGAFELVYIAIAIIALHTGAQYKVIADTFFTVPWHDHHYLYLAAANIGAVIMPWMIFYQQSAIVDKGLKKEHLKISRLETFFGAIITQLIMIAVIVAVAATIGRTNPGTPLNTVQQISHAIIPFVGVTTGKILFALGMLGASLIACIVVALTAAWSLAEIGEHKCSLQDCPKEAPHFYGCYFAMVLIGGLLILSKIHLVHLNVAIEVMNALLLPIVLGFLFLLARKALPDSYKLKGLYAWIVGIILFVTSAFGLIAGIGGIFGWG